MKHSPAGSIPLYSIDGHLMMYFDPLRSICYVRRHGRNTNVYLTKYKGGEHIKGEGVTIKDSRERVLMIYYPYENRAEIRRNDLLNVILFEHILERSNKKQKNEA